MNADVMSFTARIAVLMTCFNRRSTTLRCLRGLFTQTMDHDISLDVYLVDDASTDGTAEAVAREFPKVRILRGNGSLFWGGGMRLAWAEAANANPDYYLWLNDDTLLLEMALSTLIAAARQVLAMEKKEAIIVGSCYHPDTGEHSYGGQLMKKRDSHIIPNNLPQECELMNGNIVLVPRAVFQAIGSISPEFAHTSADNDYGLRARKAGFKLWIAPGYQGTCAGDNYVPWMDSKVRFRERWRSMHSPKGQPPYEVYVYGRRHNGILWPLDLVRLYFRVFFPRMHDGLKHLMGSR